SVTTASSAAGLGPQTAPAEATVVQSPATEAPTSQKSSSFAPLKLFVTSGTPAFGSDRAKSVDAVFDSFFRSSGHGDDATRLLNLEATRRGSETTPSDGRVREHQHTSDATSCSDDISATDQLMANEFGSVRAGKIFKSALKRR